MSGAVVLHQKRLMRRFREAMATDPKSARTPAEIGCRNSWVFRRMVARGVFIATKDGRYYMDEHAATCFVTYRRQKALVFCAAAIFLALVVTMIGWYLGAI